MVAYLVGDDVSIGKVAIGANLTTHALEELKVEVDRLVGGAVERSAGRGGIATSRVDGIAEDDHLGRLVGAAHLLELTVPNVLGASQDTLAEGHELLIHLAVVLFVDILG